MGAPDVERVGRASRTGDAEGELWRLARGREAAARGPGWRGASGGGGCAAWDAAANRYVLGLVAYRLIAGVHAFEGAGLRRAIAEQEAGAPPFEDAIARAIEPGVQSFVLAMLSGDPRARPRDAAAIATRC